MKKKIKIILSILLVLILVGSLVGAVKARHSSTTVQTTKLAPAKKGSTVRKKAATPPSFYRKIYPITAELDFVNYPQDFTGLIESGELTVVGQITALKSYVYQGSTVSAYTLATIKVQQVLAHTGKRVPKSIKVLFAGGNIRKDILLAHLATKDFISDQEKAALQSTEIVTAKYSYRPLPQINQELAVIVSREPAGTNGVDQPFYMPVFSGKAVFLKQKNGRYQREAANNESRQELLDDQQMNQGMTDRINVGRPI